ncbi:MAG: efflux RND transporter periplasmic adaptor subunit, partial [Patescibacteria group bacterium]|nr:efflux RND transporter periplasmic adaptor subunit [Patescibacteria group bacterium]
MKKSRWRFLKSWWFIAIAVIIVLIVVISAVRSSNQPPNFDTASAQIGTVTELVSVTGSVSPIGKADLAFEKSGVISEIYVKVGDQI